MNELFNALLDISKLDAGVLVDQRHGISDRAAAQTHRTHVCGGGAREGPVACASCRAAPGCAAIPSCSSASCSIWCPMRCATPSHGGVVVGCRRRGDAVAHRGLGQRIGIPEDQQRNIFGEFYQLGGRSRDRRAGLGLGLAIVDRLCRLLDHPIELTSTPRQGLALFRIGAVGRAARRRDRRAPTAIARDRRPGARQARRRDRRRRARARRHARTAAELGLPRGRRGASDDAALAGLATSGRPPDLIISDYRWRMARPASRPSSACARALGAAHPGLPHQRRHRARAAARGQRQRLSPAAQAGRPDDAARHAQSAPAATVATGRHLQRRDPDCSMRRRRGQVPAQRPDRDDRLGAVGDLQRLQDRR